MCCSSSDNNSIIWDFANYDVKFEIYDRDGNNLLDPNIEQNITKQNISIQYNKKTYKVEEIKIPNTRYNMPYPLGFRLIQLDSKPIILSFGEFSPEKNYQDESFKIIWEDGTIDEVRFDLYITWQGNKNPLVHKELYFNDKLQHESWTIKIVKE